MPHRATAGIRCFLWVRVQDTAASASRNGFSVTEALIAIAIITILGVQTVFSFSSLRETAPLRKAVRELAFQIRKMQTSALNVTILPNGLPANRIGLQFQKNATSYIVFGDTDESGHPNNDPDPMKKDYISPPFSFSQGVKINRIELVGAIDPNPATAQLIFTAPEATVAFYTTAADGTVTKEVNATIMRIVLVGSQNSERAIAVSAAGQISIPQ
ncbi:MAG: hypothetical protein G01um101466_215 [Parcubacteria group bacterium Gr01-1014_66]|nr:MAG: hypothetical protein G01um101466_215 [Parcubacteria group bacterium Gr01-1014_66]